MTDNATNTNDAGTASEIVAPVQPIVMASCVGNFTPINPIELAEQTGLPLDDVLAFFDEEFGGLDKYVQACADREELGRQLARLNSDA